MAVTCKEPLAQAVEWLQHDERVSYRAYKRPFDLDDHCVEALTDAEYLDLLRGFQVSNERLGFALNPRRMFL